MHLARIALLVPSLVAMGTLVACSSPPPSAKAAVKTTPSQYEVQLEGEYPNSLGSDPKVKFEGGCLVTMSDVSSESKMTEATTPTRLTYTGQSISCSYQKQDAVTFRLKATVKKDGVTVKETSTDARYGIVSFAV